MNPMIWYFFNSRNDKLELNYTSSRYFRLFILTTDVLPILIDFGDGVVNSVANNTFVEYDALVLRNGQVKILTPNRLRFIAASIFTGQVAVNWNFSLGSFLICKNLIAFDFRSGNVFGSAVNLSQTLEIFQVLSPSFGVVSGTEQQIPASIKTFNQTSTNANYQHTMANVSTFMVNLTAYAVSGISKLTGNLALLPANIITINLNNTGTRLHEVSYYTSSGLKVWASNMTQVILRCATGQGLTTSMLDALLIDLDATTWLNTGNQVIRLVEGHGTRSSASNAAVTNLSTVRNVLLQLN